MRTTGSLRQGPLLGLCLLTAAAGKLLVTFAPEAGQRVEAALAQGSTPTSTGLAWLDALNEQYLVRRMEPVFGGSPTSRPESLRYIYKLTLRPEADVRHAAVAYGAQPDVAYAQPNYLATIQPAP